MRSYLLFLLWLSCYCSSSLAEPIRIVAIGDSNIAGKGMSEKDTYPAKLEAALRAKGYDVQVKNAGIIGDTTQGLLRRLDNDVPLGTRVAIVWIGINDLRVGIAPEQVESDRKAIAKRLEARGTKVLLLGPRTGLADQPQYLIGDRQRHLNSAGYDVIVNRSLADVEMLLR